MKLNLILSCVLVTSYLTTSAQAFRIDPSSIREDLNLTHSEPEPVKISSVTPLNYTIRIRPVLDDGFEKLKKDTAEVLLTARVKVVEASKTIELQHKDLRINLNGVTLTNLKNGKPVQIENRTDEVIPHKPSPYDDHPPLPSPSSLKIQVKEKLQLDDELELQIPYELNLTEAIHHSSYSILLDSVIGFDSFINNATNKSEKFAVSTLEKYNTKNVIPLFINTTPKTPFKIIVGRVDGKYESLSNTKRASTETDSINKGWVWDHYEETIPLLPHQIFMLVSTLSNHTVEVPDTNTVLSFWATKQYLEEHKAVVTSVTDIASKLIQFYGKFLGNVSLPTGKLDILRLPTQSTYSAQHLGVVLLNGGRDPLTELEPSLKDLTRKIGSEIARQWFGAIVNIGCFHCHHETLLEENLFTYLRYLGIKHVLPEYSFEELFDIGTPSFTDQYTRTRIKLLEDMLGRPVIETALTLLIEKSKGTVATETDFYDSINESIKIHNATHLLPEPGLKVQEILPDWLTYNTEIIVKAKLVADDTLSLSQEGYDSWRPNDTAVKEIAYWTPVVIKMTSGELVKLWIPKTGSKEVTHKKENGTFLDGNNFLLINPDGVAPYRVLYDSNLTKALANQLVRDHEVIPVTKRIRLFNDYFNLANHVVFIEDALELTKYLEKEENERVWRVVVDQLLYKIQDYLIKDDDASARAEFQRYFAPKLQTLVKNVGMKSWYSLQKVCLGYAVPECVRFVKEGIEKLRKEPNLDLNAVFSSPVPASEFLCLAVSESNDSSTWDLIRDRFFHSDGKQSIEKYYLVEGLACSKNSTQISNFLQESLTLHDEGIQREIYESFAVSRELETKKLLYDFAKTNVRSKKITPMVFADIISKLKFSSRVSPNMGADLRSFIDSDVVIKELLMEVLPTVEAHLKENFNSCLNCDWWNSTGNKAVAWISLQK